MFWVVPPTLPSYSTRCGGVGHVLPQYLVSVMENYLDQIWWLDIYTRLFIALGDNTVQSSTQATYLPITALSHQGWGVSCILLGKDIKYPYISKPRVKKTFQDSHWYKATGWYVRLQHICMM